MPAPDPRESLQSLRSTPRRAPGPKADSHGKDRVSVLLRLDPDLRHELKTLAAIEQRTFLSLCDEALRMLLKQRGRAAKQAISDHGATRLDARDQ